jgi:hypothetical protein
MPSVLKNGKGDSSVRAIQALMCTMGADPPGYFDPIPRQPLKSAMFDSELPPLLRCLEWVRFHTVSYDGVPKNPEGEPQWSPCCVGVDGKRLNRLDCARETGLSASVVNRQFATLHRRGYLQVKKDGSIWYRAKVDSRTKATVRTSISECLKRPQNRAGREAEPVLQRLVTKRVIPVSLAEAAQSFPVADREAVENHILGVARWEREEIARQTARVRREAERRYQAGSWHGCRLGKEGRSWARMPAQQELFSVPQEPSEVANDQSACEPENSFADSSPVQPPDNGDCSSEKESETAASKVDAAEHIRRVFAGTSKGVPTDPQITQALAYLPEQATAKGFAAFIQAKLPAIRHAGAVVRLAEEYAYEIRYSPPPPVFRCTHCRDEGFVMPGGQFCDCTAGRRRRRAEEQGLGAGP